MAFWLIIGALLACDSAAARSTAEQLSQQIDQRLAARFTAEKVVPAERSTDTEFLRRLSLDLLGRIPHEQEIRRFIADQSPDKRKQLIEQMLADPAHAKHFARGWRALLLPEAETEPQVRYFLPGFEAWLEQGRRKSVGFDEMVRELLTVPIARPDETPQFVLRDMRSPNPIAFLAAKEADPAKIASSSVRLFLGLRLECAQCHDHPFDHWTRKQFWNQAAFFAGLERRGKGTFAPLVEKTDLRTIPLMESKTDLVPALFLDLSQPKFEDRQSSRTRFAEWMTASDNPYFARAVANRVWSQLMGTGIVEPVDDFRDGVPPSHAELLQELADGFKSSGFDMGFLLRSICLTEAYQRTSRKVPGSQAGAELFASMAVKPLSAEQFFDSLAQAIGEVDAGESNRMDGEENPRRRRARSLLVDGDSAGNPETSVTQALALMNGNVVDEAVTLKKSKRLQQVTAAHPDNFEKQVESLYLSTFSRFPNESEKRSLKEFAGRRDAKQQSEVIGDIFWMLLNSPEFRWNH